MPSISQNKQVKLKLIKLNHFHDWTKRIHRKEDPLFYDHLMYFKEEIVDITTTLGQTKTARLLNMSQAKLSNILQLLSSQARPYLTPSSTHAFLSFGDYLDWVRNA